MFSMDGHSFQWIWTRFGVLPPYNLRMVVIGYFCRETVLYQSTVGSFRMPRVEAAAISLGQHIARQCYCTTEVIKTIAAAAAVVAPM